MINTISCVDVKVKVEYLNSIRCVDVQKVNI